MLIENPGEDKDHFLPRKFRWYTIGALIFLFGLGVLVAISGLFNFLLLGVGELALYSLYQRKWKKIHRENDRVGTEKVDTKSFSFGRYVLLAWIYAMIMEFCVDFGAYGTINPGVVLVIMAVLTPHYFFMAAVFRLWFKWYTYSAREAYFTMGMIGFLLESIILKLFAGTFELGGHLAFPDRYSRSYAKLWWIRVNTYALPESIRATRTHENEEETSRGHIGNLGIDAPRNRWDLLACL